MVAIETKEYDRFIFREDNRDKIDKNHVQRIKQSIQHKNLLKFRPVHVNKNWEILDGQHRVMACKELGIPFYYEVIDRMEPSDIISLNTQKVWQTVDYFNYYCKNHYPEYLKLQQFMIENPMSINHALGLIFPKKRSGLYENFKKGDFKFEEALKKNNFELAVWTTDFVRVNGDYINPSFLRSARWFKSLMYVFSLRGFDEKMWKKNLERLVSKIKPKVNADEYIDCLLDIYNYRLSEGVIKKDQI